MENLIGLLEKINKSRSPIITMVSLLLLLATSYFTSTATNNAIERTLDKCEGRISAIELDRKSVPEWREKTQATTHIDGTARPQVVYQHANPSYHKIITEYYKISGIPVVINTSFNMHEEPIVATPNDAIRSFQQGCLDYLAIGNFLCKFGA